jgi:hypothetical protein|eukprot:SAG25_NODE_144_length_14010_cov_17.620300_4_plen_58_part_00
MMRSADQEEGGVSAGIRVLIEQEWCTAVLVPRLGCGDEGHIDQLHLQAVQGHCAVHM